MMSDFKNYPLWTAVVTPLNNDLSIDFESFEKLLRLQDEAHNGVLILGSTGEALNLGLEEKQKVIELASSLNLSVPIMVGVGGINLEETKSWMSFCQNHAIHSFLLVTPLYAKPGKMGQIQWFESLLNHSLKPCVLYNIPSRAGTSLHLQAVSALKDHPQFQGIKEASGCVEEFKKYQDAAPNIDLYSGDDALMPIFSEHGAKGLISVASNAWPRETHLFVDYCLERQKELVLPLWEKASQALFSASNPVPVKSLMCENKLIKTPFLRPPLNHEDISDLSELKSLDKEVKNWFNQKQ